MPVATSQVQTSSLASLPTQKQPQSILRRSSSESYHKKRPSSSSPTDSQSSTSSKRHKVSFTPRPTVYILADEASEKSATHVAAEVRNALINHNEGNGSQHYEELTQVFTASEDDDERPSDSYICKCILGLASNSHLIKRNSSSLVHAILHMKWLHWDDDFVAKFQRFLNQLVVSQSGYVRATLKMLTENFAHLSTSSEGVRRTPGLTRKTLQDRVHSCIRQILVAVPSATSVLCNILTDNFPYPTDTRRAHSEYVGNLLRLSTSNPELLSHIVDLILDRLLQIDLQIQKDVAEIEDEISEMLIRQGQLNQTSILEDDETSAASSESSDSDEDDPEAAQLKALRLLIHKLDTMLDQLFIHLHPLLTKSTPQSSQQLFNHLLGHLRNVLLRTPSSRHLQFLLFWAAQTQPDYAHQFLSTVLDVATDNTRPSILRVAALSYTASFTARASTISSDTVLYVTDTLVAFINRYRKLYETPAARPDPHKYAPYYAAVQTCLYLFCFRWRDLIDSADPEDTDDDLLDAAFRQEIKWDPSFKDALTAAVAGKLNPLKVCSAGVLDEFADVAYRFGLMYVYSIMESNKRVRLWQAGARGLQSEQEGRLEGWFPFDPLTLPKSRKWVDPAYREYANPLGGAGQEHGESDEEMASVKEESEDEVDESDVGTPESD